ncbi:hypothetical protein [Paenarthrobacter ureafaciens]|uniref:hypothetical protein n=1 Tax=Paenarthrobacter ureafaciens TaxID=37931 RepID=UPI001C2C93C3|nr:hypothetical protein [Paenarthrobacter ureafaciens]UOD81980.1 hypothetical protein MQZ73_03580 [Paenarthrobacter ureafaciens]WNZ05472.1 hypothetical protein PVT25_08120 [Paenarthrobacter ureafaciens]
MGQIDNLTRSEISDIFRRIRALEFSSNQNHMAIGRGSGLRVHDGGSINIENGGLNVTGSANISGTLNASGNIDMSGSFTASGDVNLNGPTDITGVTTIQGDTTVTGDFTVTGPTALNGTTTVAGDTTVTGVLTVNGAMKTTSTLSVEGVTTLKNDLNVTTGKVKAGSMTIDPTLFGGSVQFSGGGYLSGTVSGPQLTGPSGNAFVYAGTALAGIQATSIRLAGAVDIQGALKVTSPGTVTGVTPNVYMDSSGNLRKIN